MDLPALVRPSAISVGGLQRLRAGESAWLCGWGGGESCPRIASGSSPRLPRAPYVPGRRSVAHGGPCREPALLRRIAGRDISRGAQTLAVGSAGLGFNRPPHSHGAALVWLQRVRHRL